MSLSLLHHVALHFAELRHHELLHATELPLCHPFLLFQIRYHHFRRFFLLFAAFCCTFIPVSSFSLIFLILLLGRELGFGGLCFGLDGLNDLCFAENSVIMGQLFTD